MFHPSPVTTARANISLLVLAGSSQAVRERSAKLSRDRVTVRLSLGLIAYKSRDSEEWSQKKTREEMLS